MDRAIPGVGNKYLQSKWENEKRQKEIQKLRQVKSLVDIKNPTKFKHLSQGGKLDFFISLNNFKY